MKKPVFVDLHSQDEDKRIQMIGQAVMTHRKLVGFVVEAEAGKGARYIKKLKERFPGIVVLDRRDGPVAGCETIRVAPPPSMKDVQ